MKVLYIVMDQMEESEAIVPIDLLRRANLEVVSCSLQDKTVTTSHNIKVEADILLDEADESYDCIVLPGGAGHRAYFENEELTALVLKYHKAGKYIAAICAAPTYLGKLGLLKGKKYTCFTPMNEDFGGEYVDTYALRDDKLITGRSMAAGIPFGLELISALCSEEKMQEVRKAIIYE